MVFMGFLCFFDFSGPRGGLEGILELLDATEELFYPLRGILDAIIALLEPSYALLRVIRWPKGGPRNSSLSTTLQQQAAERGGGEDKPLPGTGDRRFRFEEGSAPKNYTP